MATNLTLTPAPWPEPCQQGRAQHWWPSRAELDEPVHATAEMLPGGRTHTLGRVSTLTQHNEAVALTASLGSGCGHAADAVPGLQMWTSDS